MMMESKLKEYIAPRMEVIAMAYQSVLAGSIVTTDVVDNDDEPPIGPAMSPGFDFIEEEDFLQ